MNISYTRGNTVPIIFTLDASPTVTAAKFIVREHKDDSTETPIVSLTLGSGLTVSGSMVTVSMPIITAAARPYFYGLELTVDGYIETVAKGRFDLEPEVSQ